MNSIYEQIRRFLSNVITITKEIPMPRFTIKANNIKNYNLFPVSHEDADVKFIIILNVTYKSILIFVNKKIINIAGQKYIRGHFKNNKKQRFRSRKMFTVLQSIYSHFKWLISGSVEKLLKCRTE